jgi:hypothetical protein
LGRRYGTILAPVTGNSIGKRFHQFNLLSEGGVILQPTLYVILSPFPPVSASLAAYEFLSPLADALSQWLLLFD